MNDRILSLLGLARRAGKLSLGHDAAIDAIVRNKAKLCFVCRDGSQRLKNEMSHACTYENKNITFKELDCETAELSKAVGSKAAVLTVNDEGFAKAIAEKTDKTA
ncbi:MAG: ribosomal L7Ae/L30e/S12e/Gadd45 family protein [Ruminococcus sp.]|nr:ribosomal L7Ae/L30e/S12e/Gadd45 family protein [Ruminococcus sp.]